MASMLETWMDKGQGEVTKGSGTGLDPDFEAARAGVVLLKNEAASKQEVLERLSSSPWTHVACHAHPAVKLRDFLPLHLCPIDALATRPALFLARPLDGDADLGVEVDGVGNAAESLLTVDDVREIELVRGCVVVLSACCTGQGHTSKSEGIVGLARAFLFAGASTVICTLWEVPDKSQKLLMHRFYSLVRQGQDLCSALFEAQLSIQNIAQAELEMLDDAVLLDKWSSRGKFRTGAAASPTGEKSHYRHWAGIVLIGSTHPPWTPASRNLPM